MLGLQSLETWCDQLPYLPCLQQGEVAMVDVAAEVWKAAPQKAAQAIDRLMALRLVSGTAIVNWVFDSHGVRQLDNQLATGLAWEVFYNAIDKMLARAQVGCLQCVLGLGSGDACPAHSIASGPVRAWRSQAVCIACCGA